MNRLKFLLKNTAIFAISQFASKVIVFFLLPFYTSYMSTADYGNADFVTTTISLLLPIFTAEIASATMRFAIERKENANPIFTNGFVVMATGFALLLCFIPVFKYFHLFDGYLYLFYLQYIANALYNLFSYYARALGEIKLVGVAGFLNTVVLLIRNIVMLKFLHKGIQGYLLSYVLGYAFSVILLVLVLRKSLKLKLEKGSIKDMFKYSLPLVPNNISWWGVSSANKYVIYGFLTDSILGLYSVALKIPSIINTFQSVMAESLVLTVFEEYNKGNKDEEYFSFLYRVYNFSMILFVSAVIIGSKIIARVLFQKEFFEAWRFVPLLCVPAVWGALSGYLGTFYAAAKKNKGMFFSTALGGLVTVVFSFLTVKKLGVSGIIWGNVLAYFTIWLYRWLDVKKIVKLDVNLFIDAIGWGILIAQALVVVYVKNSLLSYGINILLLLLVILINRKQLKFVVHKVKELLKSGKEKLKN